MKERAQQPYRIKHKGPLTMSSLLESFSGGRSAFRAAGRKAEILESGRDPFHMGWENVPYAAGHSFEIEGMNFATAEGAVAFATLVDCLKNRCGSNVSVTPSRDSATRSWWSALQLEQVGDVWSKEVSAEYSKVAGVCYAYPLWRQSMTDRNTCAVIAKHISDQVHLLIDALHYEQAEEMSTATELIFREALLNVLEHAYGPNQEPVVVGAVTLTPMLGPPYRDARIYATTEELEWFDAFAGRGLMLEVAVADYGRNVPSSLWAAYRHEHGESKDSFEQMRKLSLGASQTQALRARLHQNISLWAFNHQSTRKAADDFPSPLFYHNWRGLHRALNKAARFQGCLVVRSGVARTGYAFYEDRSATLTSLRTNLSDFPGTGLTLRIPILTKRRSVASTAVSREKLDSASSPLEVGRIVSITEAAAPLGTNPTKEVVAITHAFKPYRSFDIPALLEALRPIPPKVVGVHMFAGLEEALFQELHAFSPDSDLADWGIPRLAAFWEPRTAMKWKFIGLMPERARSMVEALETQGVAHIDTDPITTNFAKELLSTYAPLLSIDGESIRLLCFNSHLADESQIVQQALESAFDGWAANQERESWLFDFNNTGKYVLLPTGRTVKKYISILRILYQSDGLSRIVGWRLASMLREFKSKIGSDDLCLVTESMAGYLIANKLLEDESDMIPIYIGTPPDSASRNSVVVFADVIYKAESLGTLLAQIGRCHHVICCMDLRRERGQPLEASQTPVDSLIPFHFDPEEVKSSLVGSDVLEVDTTTHIPTEKTPVEKFLIGTNSHRNEFVLANPHLFRYGLHKSGRRIHVATLPVRQIIQTHRGQLLEWIENSIRSCVEEIPDEDLLLDIVIFTRNEADVAGLVEDLGRRLNAGNSNPRRVFSAILPIVPLGAREVFGRLMPELDLLEGTRRVGTNKLPFEEAVSKYVAVYLDDSCVSGKTLLNFIRRASLARREQVPQAILTLPVVSRFSPAEEHFYRDICREINVPDQPKRRVPFLFRPLFRLQVRSFETLQSTPSYALALELSNLKPKLDARLQQYVGRVEHNLASATAVDFRENLAPTVCQHPFYSGIQSENDSLTARVMWIRHLIALQEQNEAVLSELLKEVVDACNENDFSLLMMLAVEPSLLENFPLRTECRPKITELALSALKSEDASNSTKSDALCVLALQGRTFIRVIQEVLPIIAQKSELLDQLLSYVLLKKPRIHNWPDEVLDAVDQSSASMEKEELHYVRTCIRSFELKIGPKTVVDEAGARRAIRSLIAKTAYHAKGFEAIGNVNDWLALGKGRNKKDGLTVQSLLNEAIIFLRNEILPAIEALSWLADLRHNQTAKSALESARAELIESLFHLEDHSGVLEGGDIGIDNAVAIEGIWSVVRKNSMTRTADKILSRWNDPKDAETPILEYWMPEFFSIPYEIVLAEQTWDATVDPFTSDGHSPVSALVPLPVESVKRIFELLMSDMRKHGQPGSFRIKFELKTNNGLPALTALFTDRAKQKIGKGAGRSQEAVRAIAEELRLRIQFPQSARPGEPYKTELHFPDVMRVPLEFEFEAGQ